MHALYLVWEKRPQVHSPNRLSLLRKAGAGPQLDWRRDAETELIPVSLRWASLGAPWRPADIVRRQQEIEIKTL